MAKRVSVDRWLFTVTMLLVFVGLVMVFSASAVMARERFGSEYAFLSKQLIWAVTGLGAMVVAMRVDYKRYKHPALVFSVMGLATLLLISVFFLDRSHNTHRWIHAGGFSFQPSELAKPVLILFLAFFLEGRSKSMDDVRNTLLPAAAPVLVFLGLIVLQPDLGTAIACAGIAACIFYVAGMRMKYFGYAFAGSLGPLLFFDLSCELSAGPHPGVLESVCGQAASGISYYSVVDCGEHGRHYRHWVDGREAEAVLSDGAAYGFYFRCDCGGVGIGGGDMRGHAFRDFSVARDARFVADEGHFRALSCGGSHEQ